MATIKYLLKSKTELSTIYVRLRDGRTTDVTASTGYTINPKFWSDARGGVRQIAENSDKKNLSNDLEKLQRKISDCLNDEKGSGVPINRQWLENVVSRYKNPTLEQKTEWLIDIIRAYRDEMKMKVNPKTGRQISPNSIRGYNTTIMRLEKFEEHRKRRFSIHDVDLTFHHDFTKFERNTLTLAQNSISRDIKQIKTVCIDARDKGYKINEQVLSRKFNVASEPTTFVTITKDEIGKIKTFTGADYLQNARDWLIIGCWTGCRVNDLMDLTTNNILINPKGVRFIRYTQSKTGKQVDIPLHPDVTEILERLGGFPRPISDQRFNEWIKLVCRESGLIDEVEGTRQNPETHKKETGTFEKWQLIRSHTCRRSFATNHYRELPNKIIMAVTGHATEKMLLNYIGETDNEHLTDFLNVWSSQQQESKPLVKAMNA